jgi:hypothetical protein
MILNSIRRINREFGAKYGRIVICTDNQNYWRKSFFRNYKANRKKTRDASEIDWKAVFEILHQLRDELRETFPYKVMNVPFAEADDVIGVLAKTFKSSEPILIVSSDKDFIQLLDHNVTLYRHVQNEMIFFNPTVPTSTLQVDAAVPCSAKIFYTKHQVERFLKEHILRGDTGDGVPNYLSPDDVFVAGGRQKPIMAVKVETWVQQQPEEFCNETTLKNYYRNKTLVDLDEIPAEVQAAILEEFAVPVIGSVNKIYSYLIRHRMRNLLELIREF